MRSIVYLITALVTAAVLLVSCSSKPSLQKYYVDKSNEKGFVTFDLGASIIQTDSLNLTKEETKALESLDKLNILMYNGDKANVQKEKDSVKSLIKTGHYEQLMKLGSPAKGASISLLGEGEKIDEFVILAHGEDSFGVIRVLGDDMTPNDVMTLVSLIQKSGLDTKQLKPLQDMLK